MSGQTLVDACFNNRLPNIETMTAFGLDGWGGTNPIAVFDCYRTAVTKDNVSPKQLDEHLNSGTINKFIMESLPGVKDCKYYEQVLMKGGIKISTDEGQLECSKCNLCAVHENDICYNCGNAVKKYASV